MSFKIKSTFNLDKQLEAAQKESSKVIKRRSKRLILSLYARGISPVKGFTTFAQYAKSTAKKKGRRKPVTVRESGRLWASLTVVQKGRNSLSMFFKGARNSKIAGFLSFGTKFMDARPLLPSVQGQQFKIGIIREFNKIINSTLRKFLK